MKSSEAALIGEEAVARAQWAVFQVGLIEMSAPESVIATFDELDAEGRAKMHLIARAAISAHLAALKEAGWVVVPQVPVAEQTAAGMAFRRAHRNPDLRALISGVYTSMIEAAPPAQNGDEVKG